MRTHLALGRAALAQGDPAAAQAHFEQALHLPANLAEAKHLLANQSDLHYWLGVACEALGDRSAARGHWKTAALFQGDFQEIRRATVLGNDLLFGVAWGRLGQPARKQRLLTALLAYAKTLAVAEAKIEYFATSLPSMLLFDDDLQARQETKAVYLQAQAMLGLGNVAQARRSLAMVLRRDPNHSLAADLLQDIPERTKR